MIFNEQKREGGAPTTEQWAQLYEVAGVIRELEPREWLWESNLVTIMLPGREEPVYRSAMGRLGECVAIAVYPGYEAVNGFYRLSGSSPGDVALTQGLEQTFQSAGRISVLKNWTAFLPPQSVRNYYPQSPKRAERPRLKKHSQYAQRAQSALMSLKSAF